jgi:hypothetical protein
MAVESRTLLVNRSATRQASGRVTSRRVAATVRQQVKPAKSKKPEKILEPYRLIAAGLVYPLHFHNLGPKPIFDQSGGKTVTINADTAGDFSRQITATIGSPHTKPVFEPDIQFDTKTDAAGREVPGSRKITSIGLKVKTAITKVRFGRGRPNKQHSKAINEMVAAIRDHEETHRAIIEEDATLALLAAQKFVGTGETTKAEKALTTDLECATNKKHEALDAVEGLLTAVELRNGSVKVTKSSSGAKYKCP